MQLGLGLGMSYRGPTGIPVTALMQGAAVLAAWDWSNPFDGSLFQDRAGTTPVTAVGQSVGLIMDKAPLTPLGSDLLNPASWLMTATAPAVATNSPPGTIYLSSDGVQPATADISFPTTVGLVYRLTVTTGTGNIATCGIGTTKGGSTIYNAGVGPNLTSYTIHFTATATTTWVRFLRGASGQCNLSAISVKEVNGYPLIAPSDAARASIQQDTGKPYLLFDGVDDRYASPTITPGVDKCQMFAGVYKASDAARGIVAEFSPTTAANNGSFALAAPNAASDTFAFESKGTVLASAAASGYAAPAYAVLTGLGDISGDSAILRRNGSQVAQATSDQGTGNFGAYALNVGARSGGTLPFGGRLYAGLFLRFSAANLDTALISATEAYIAARMPA